MTPFARTQQLQSLPGARAAAQSVRSPPLYGPPYVLKNIHVNILSAANPCLPREIESERPITLGTSYSILSFPPSSRRYV